jgi:23S rRNA pseudouridine955/2504/2580 synthase/23S rRNA pseudouridine1911/1915/1917 synthase
MITLDILYEDDAIIAVNKPPRLLIVPDRWDRNLPTIQDMLREYLRKKMVGEHPNIRVIHRLDKDTSGVVLLAKNVKAQAYVSKQFEKGEVSKTYYALVKGAMKENDGLINLALSESTKTPGTMVVSKKGKKSITRFQVLERFRGFTFVEANPLTGRTHQVRVHLRAYGFPLAIDPIYGEIEPLYLSQLKKDYKPKEGVERPLIDRLPLHAFRLSFREPTEEKTMVLEAPLPRDMVRTLKHLRKYAPIV